METMKMMLDPETDEETEVPAKFEVCDRCEGRGKHTNPSIDGNGIPAEDFHEDPDFMEDYLSGVYDVACYECKGQRVVKVPDYSRMDPGLEKCVKRAEQQAAEYRRELAHEARMREMGIQF